MTGRPWCSVISYTRTLFGWTGDAAFMDYYERALWNHILGSQDPETAGVCYFTPLRPGLRKPFQSPFDDFTCCVGTGFENHGAYGEAIYALGAVGKPELYVNLFIPSVATWADQGVVVKQETRFPDDGRVRLLLKEPESNEKHGTKDTQTRE